MRVLVTGATGLIGTAVCARLIAEGHHVVRLARRTADGGSGPVIVLDMARALRPQDWSPFLENVDAVVNCAGVLQDSAQEHTREVHATAAAALFEACQRAGVIRIIHFSAIGVERQQPSAFSASKLAGDEALMKLDLNWVILRPSVVLGRSVFGASALFRGLASLPVLPSMPMTGRLQVVQLDDVVETVSFFLRSGSPSRLAIDLAGPEAIDMDEVIAHYRRWLGWRPARRIMLPGWAAALLYRLGDLAGAMGWRPPMRTNAAKEITRGATGDHEGWTAATGIEPTSLGAALATNPANVQDRWFAGLYLIKPAIFVVLPFFWIMTGIISLTTGWDRGVALLIGTAVGALAPPAVVAGALADLLIGTLIAFRRTARIGLWGAVGICLFYAVAGSILRPDLWNEPLGPLLKILPIFLLHLVALAILGGTLMLYLVLKYLHVLGATVLLGTGAGIAFFMLLAHLTGNAATVAAVARMVVIADFLFTATAVVVQPITGIALAWHVNYSLWEGWIALSLVLYVLTGAFWLPVVWMQMRLRNLAAEAAEQNRPLPKAYHRLFWWWFAFGFPAFAAVLAIFWLMIARPAFVLWPLVNQP